MVGLVVGADSQRVALGIEGRTAAQPYLPVTARVNHLLRAMVRLVCQFLTEFLWTVTPRHC
jgi:hypothetical protein